jgi:membrane fusion protein (multidrug efflux system)
MRTRKTMTRRSPARGRDARLAGLLLAAAGGLWLAGCERPGAAAEGDKAEVPRNVRVLEVRASEITEYFEISGPMQPLRGTDVGAEESGTVALIPHDKGKRVEEGDVLVELDRRLLAAELEAARSALRYAEHDFEKTQELYEAGKVSRQALLSVESAYEQARATARIAEVRHDRAAVKAPFAGLVADRYVEPGQLVAAGAPVARVIDPFLLKLVGTLTEREIGWLEVGTAAEVILDGVARPVAGRVHWIGFEADPASGKFKVEIVIDNPDLALRTGVIGRARILKEVHPDVVAIPRDAVLKQGGGWAVFVVDGERVHRRRVSLGPDQGLMVVVVDGLAPGERLVVRGQRDLIDGARVTVTEESAAPDGTRPEDPDVVKEAATRRQAWSDPEGGA